MNKIKLVLNHLGIDYKIRTFEQISLIQRSIYMVQVGGVKLGYDFYWHFCPFSRSLKKDIVELMEVIHIDYRNLYFLDQKTSMILDKLRPFLESPYSNLAKNRWLILLSSIHFLS